LWKKKKKFKVRVNKNQSNKYKNLLVLTFILMSGVTLVPIATYRNGFSSLKAM